jgi:hypothetical protein
VPSACAAVVTNLTRIVDALGKSSASRRRIIERRECAATITEPARCSAIRIISYNIASVMMP